MHGNPPKMHSTWESHSKINTSEVGMGFFSARQDSFPACDRKPARITWPGFSASIRPRLSLCIRRVIRCALHSANPLDSTVGMIPVLEKKDREPSSPSPK
ncbi:hypothetical protein CDAR_577201 [Caerostris darwini]|uniref:Uncharacterized protein n=1 Tax=Caerostris darwini TaxID=1538125 RepID=A0AAV4UGJ4_9ARAC|nr:hypothetical protein CDAR_577201 [Caerostris darwini]